MNNGNYIGRRDDASGEGPSASAAPQEDDHAHEAALGFALHTDGPDRLGWLMKLNQARGLPLWAAAACGGCFGAVLGASLCAWPSCDEASTACSALPACHPSHLPALPPALPGLPCPALQSQKVDKESGHAVSVVNCYFMCQVSTAQHSTAQHSTAQRGAAKAAKLGGLWASWAFVGVWCLLLTCPPAPLPVCLQDGGMFKAQVEYAPYFYLQIKVGGWRAGWVGGWGGRIAG